MVRRHGGNARRRRAAGFTLIEVALAIAILGLVTVSLMSASARMIRGITDDRAETIAATAAEARVAMVRQWPTYGTLEAIFAGTEANTPQPGFTRVTTIVRTGGVGQPNDFKRITVTVTGPRLPAPVSRTISTASP